MNALIVDDHTVARSGLRTILQESFVLDGCHEADNCEDAIRLASRHRPDLVLVDMHIPNSMPAHELCRQLRALLPEARIVIVTAFDRLPEIRDCLAAGADGCLLKDTSEVDFTAALRTVRAGRAVLDPRIAQRLADELVGRQTGFGGEVHLTTRERDVLQLIAEGCANRAISERLQLSEATVKGYVSSLLEKLQVSSRLEALVRASDAGLI
ncbi:MAG: response regulator transcription factor [Actinomycetota bacterium]|nr:response regulator transcription factor [Actinomycetota bacterium]